ncbi:MAG TPA: hypothetical protein VFC00_14585 [Micromonosporaceae bacterium]|nr:hypothetical protein [Micromonosporaceae bacterium]
MPPPNLRAVPDQTDTEQPEPYGPPEATNSEPAADHDLIEMLTTYIEERLHLGQQAMNTHTEGSVQWMWGHIVVDEMTTILAMIRGIG